MTLQVTNDDWSEKLSVSLTGAEDRYLLGEFTSPFVIIAIASTIANPVWSKAGGVAQAIDTAIGKAYGKKQELFLRDLNLVNSTALTSGSYELYYFPLDRLGSTNIKVYEYQGQTIDSQIQVLIDSLNQSDFLSEDLAGIGAKIDRILSEQEQFDTTYATNTSEIKDCINLILDRLTPTEPPKPPEPPQLNYLELRTLQLI